MQTYTEEEVQTASIEYFNGDELAANVFRTKYALRNDKNELLEKTPYDMHKRLAREFARIEKNKFENPLSENEIFELFDKFKYIVCQGSPMFGIGNPYQYVSIGNCFVLPSPTDSYLSINYTDSQIVQISCRRGGVGWDISKLRPSGLSVQNAAKTTSGAVSFLHRFSNTVREVAQNGRRAASLVSISVHHPDILDFIKVKRDLTKVTGSNITVQFTDEFMKAVENDTEFELRWPVSKEDAKEMNRPFPLISKMVKARDIWNEFIIGARDFAEPGACYIDQVHRESTGYNHGHKEISSNPCLSKKSKLITKDGIRNLEDINIGDVIWSKDGWTTVINKIFSGNKQVYKYKTRAGYFLGTDNHKILQNGKKIEIKDAEFIDILPGEFSTNNIILDNHTIMDGLVIGDGSYHAASSSPIHLNIGENDADYFNSEISHLILFKRNSIGPYAYEIISTITKEELPHTYLRKVPDRFKYGNKSTVCSFLRGLYSANGSVCDNRIILKQSSFQIIEDVQLMLSYLGITSYYTTNKPSMVKFKNGEYLCKQSYDLNITTDREKFVKLIGFIQSYKNDKIKIVNHCKPKKESYEIVETEYIGEEDVYDITVDNVSHTYWSQGHNISNCGEQYLPAYSSCRLICNNLNSYVNNRFINPTFDFDLFYKHCYIMQRLADDIVDLELEAIERIINKIKNDPEPQHIKQIGLDLWENIKKTAILDRRTGCGFTAFGDCLASMNIKYGSEESIEFARKTQRIFRDAAYQCSIDIAKEKGAFQEWNWENDIKSTFIQRLAKENPKLWEEMKKYGRANMVLLTIAPTGSVSCLTQTTSGIEPVFMLEYKRRKKGNPGDAGFKTDFVDQNGDHWQEFIVRHKGLQDWMNITGKTDIKESPYFNATANEINWINKVRLQGALQEAIDNSISITTNLPNDVSYEEVDRIYMESWKVGNKGCTVYRDGCRTGVLVDKNTAEKKCHTIQERPKELPCDVYHTTIKGTSYFVFVGLMDGEPYEIFAGKNGFIDKNVKTGVIIKNSKRRYKAILEDETELSPITASTSDQEEAITRLTSALLRSGTGMLMIVQQLERVGGDMHSFAKGLARILKKYIPDNTPEKDEKCPECNSNSIVRNSGCQQCVTCGWSRCN